MIKVKIVKTAKIRIVKAKELRVGDRILYMNWQCIVDEIQRKHGIKVTFHPVFDENIIETEQFLNYYVIDDCDEIVEEIE